MSANIRMEVSGVRSSWLTFDTKSVWSFERFASRARKTSDKTVPVTSEPTNVTTRIPKTRLSSAFQNTSMRMPSASRSPVGTMTNQMRRTTMRRNPRLWSSVPATSPATGTT